MPWFITAIYTQKTAASLLAISPDHDPKYLAKSPRTFGFYNTYIEASNAVEENRGSMNECVYDYIVIELIEPGIYAMVRATSWWTWNTTTNKWEYLSTEGPSECRFINMWALR